MNINTFMDLLNRKLIRAERDCARINKEAEFHRGYCASLQDIKRILDNSKEDDNDGNM